MEITPDKKSLMGLVRRASNGAIVLPEFQRNFVWSRDDITDLLISILRGYFIGTFLSLMIGMKRSCLICERCYPSFESIDRKIIAARMHSQRWNDLNTQT